MLHVTNVTSRAHAHATRQSLSQELGTARPEIDFPGEQLFFFGETGRACFSSQRVHKLQLVLRLITSPDFFPSSCKPSPCLLPSHLTHPPNSLHHWIITLLYRCIITRNSASKISPSTVLFIYLFIFWAGIPQHTRRHPNTPAYKGLSEMAMGGKAMYDAGVCDSYPRHWESTEHPWLLWLLQLTETVHVSVAWQCHIAHGEVKNIQGASRLPGHHRPRGNALQTKQSHPHHRHPTLPSLPPPPHTIPQPSSSSEPKTSTRSGTTHVFHKIKSALLRNGERGKKKKKKKKTRRRKKK